MTGLRDMKSSVWRLFGREKHVHKFLGGGKPADIFLWRDKNRSAGVLGSASAIWILFESPLRIPEVAAQEKCVVEIASALRFEVNRALAILKDIASGRELKKFLIVIAGLWIVSIVGSWFNFLTLFYIMFILLFRVPVFYEKYEDQVDASGEKAMVELKKQSMWC